MCIYCISYILSFKLIYIYKENIVLVMANDVKLLNLGMRLWPFFAQFFEDSSRGISFWILYSLFSVHCCIEYHLFFIRRFI